MLIAFIPCREGLSQADAAQRTGSSCPTFGRIAESARRKIADYLRGRSEMDRA